MESKKEIKIYCQVRLVKWPDGKIIPELFFSMTKRMSRLGKTECYSSRDGHNDATAAWMWKHPKADKETALREIANYQKLSDSLPAGENRLIFIPHR
mgnify:CR=1 FL=1